MSNASIPIPSNRGAARCSFISGCLIIQWITNFLWPNFFYRYSDFNVEIHPNQNIPATYFDWFHKRERKIAAYTGRVHRILVQLLSIKRKWINANENACKRNANALNKIINSFIVYYSDVIMINLMPLECVCMYLLTDFTLVYHHWMMENDKIAVTASA